jgi:CBS domain-containing protein
VSFDCWSNVVKVANILAVKGSTVITIAPTETIAALSQRLREMRIGAAIVSSDGQTVEGVISERDIAYALCTHKADLHAMPVSALMTKAVITCSATDSVAIVASTMMSRNVRHLPVKEGDRLVGMVSIRDVLNLRLDELQRETGLLRAFASHVTREPHDRC